MDFFLAQSFYKRRHIPFTSSRLVKTHGLSQQGGGRKKTSYSSKSKACRVLHGLTEFGLHHLLCWVSRQIQQIEAGVSHREMIAVLTASNWLYYNLWESTQHTLKKAYGTSTGSPSPTLSKYPWYLIRREQNVQQTQV